ncbi:MAG: chloride channel protein [Agathobacter sp.]|nr:chloride channel protein [Agathobacter sp.]
MNKFYIQHIKPLIQNTTITAKWVIFGSLTGAIVGLVSSAFYFVLSFVNIVREQNPWIIYLLPIGGLAIVALYKILHNEKDGGTNLVISAIHSGNRIPLRMTPSIFLSTAITHLFGGSAGREGAALQIGGSIGNALGNAFKFDEKDKHVVIMCGMSAAFSTLFGTPMAAAIFPMEVVSVGVMYYMALVPCVVSSLTAHGVAVLLGVAGEAFHVTGIPTLSLLPVMKVVLVAVICAFVSIGFCGILHRIEELYKKYLKNHFLRIFVGGCAIVLLTILVGNHDYNGAGMHTIELAVEGHVVPEAFILKMLFTALTIGAGYKGGEIVPTFYVGATLGCLLGQVLGFSPSLCAAIGMVSLFCGVTNCPISTLLISFELFGFEGMPYYLLAVAFSYMLSGYSGLYHSQKIMYSKYKTDFINRHTQ